MNNKKNTFWLAVQYIVTLLVSFVTLKLNLVNYGEHLFGIWIVFASVWGIGSVLDFGFGTAIIKYIAEACEQKDNEKINKIFSTGLLLFLTIGVCIVLAGNVIAELLFYANPKIVSPELVSPMRPVFVTLGLSFYFQYISILFRSVFEGHNNFVISSRLQIINNIFVLILVSLLAVFRYPILYLSAAYMTTSLITLVLYIAALRLKHRGIGFKTSNIDFKEIKKIFSFSVKVQVTSLLGAVIDPAIKYIIGNHASVSVVPLYEVARRLSLAVSGLFGNSFRTIIPRTSILKTPADYKDYMEKEGADLLNFGMVYSGTVFGAGALAFALIIKLWFGFTESIVIFFILSLAESVNNAGYPIYLFMLGIGKASYLIFIQLFNLIVISGSIMLGFLLLGNYLGLFGYFTSVLLANILMLYFLKREVDFNIVSFLRQIKIYKLLVFDLLVFISILMIIITSSVYLVSACLSVISFLLFFGEIKYYTVLVFRTLKAGQMAVN